jgi:hypothetical protein
LNVFVNLKQLGKRRNIIDKKLYFLENKPSTVEALIKSFVTICVKDFNDRVDNKKIITYLSKEEINNHAQVGKISFNEDNRGDKQDIDQAIENAMQSYEDGIFRIFIDDDEVGALHDEIKIIENSTLTFIRLTMLAGRMW